VGHIVHSNACGCEMSFHKKRAGTRYAKFVFLHPMRSVVHIVHSVASWKRNVEALFFMLGWDRYGLDRKHSGTSYAKLVFLDPVGSVGHVVHFSASGVRNIDALFSMLGWAR
jgi:hypothetical protein